MNFSFKTASTLAAALLALSASSPAAADMPQPTRDWAGPYLGVEFGGGIGDSSRYFSQSGADTGNFDVSGILGGMTAGYNWQFDSVVLGLEADLSGTNIGGNANCPTAGNTCEDDAQWQATFRPRLGYAIDRFLPYVTGGLAVGSIHQHAYATATGATDDEATHVEPGWTAGAGVEAATESADRRSLHAPLEGHDPRRVHGADECHSGGGHHFRRGLRGAGGVRDRLPEGRLPVDPGVG